MCCCGDEHNNDPKYKCARSSTCCTLSTEIIQVVITTILYFSVVLAAVLVCSIAKWTTVGGVAYSAYSYDFKYSGTCASGREITTTSECSTASQGVVLNACNDATAETVDDANLPTGCVCDETGTQHVLKLNTNQNTESATYQEVLYCKDSRRLQRKDDVTLPEDMKHVTPTKFPRVASYFLPGFEKKFMKEHLPKLHNGRRLDACGDDENCNKLRESSKKGCEAAETIISMFWPNLAFTIVGIVFYSITSCGTCCKSCCGGYKTQMQVVMWFSVVAALWGILNTYFHFQLYSSLADVRDVAKATGLSPDAVTVIDGLGTIKLIAALFHLLCAVLRSISAFFTFQAQQEQHSSAAENTSVQMQVVTVQGTAVQKV